jgi:hypothetical protein
MLRASHSGVAEARKTPKKGAALVLWPVLVLHGHVYWYGKWLLYHKGHVEPRGRACCMAGRAGGVQMSDTGGCYEYT